MPSSGKLSAGLNGATGIRFGGYGYGLGNGGIDVIGIILIILVVLLSWVSFGSPHSGI